MGPKFFRDNRKICHTSYSHFRDFPGPRPYSRTFQAWKMWLFKFRTLQDLYEPCEPKGWQCCGTVGYGETEKAVTGHLSEGSFARNGVVQIPTFDPNPIRFGQMTLWTSAPSPKKQST